MLHEKLFYVKQKKVDVAQKSVSSRQKQDDAAQKNYIVLKKAITFFQNGAPYILIDIFTYLLCFKRSINTSTFIVKFSKKYGYYYLTIILL